MGLNSAQPKISSLVSNKTFHSAILLQSLLRQPLSHRGDSMNRLPMELLIGTLLGSGYGGYDCQL